MTYLTLSERTGIAVSTLRKLGSKLDKLTTLGNVEKICMVLDVTPGDLLEIIDAPRELEPEPEPEPIPKKTKKKKKTTKTKKKKTPKKKN